MQWIKSSKSLNNGTCVEVKKVGENFFVRNSKNPSKVLFFTGEEWTAFIGGVAEGEFRFND